MKRTAPLLFLFALPLPGQDAEKAALPVQDLVTGHALLCRHVLPIRPPSQDHPGALQGEVSMLGEGNPRRTSLPALLTPEALANVVALLGSIEPGELRVAEGELLVPRASEAKAKGALESLRRQLAPPITVDLALDLLDQSDKPRPVLVGREVLLNGETRVLSEVHERGALVDFEVEIAQAASIACPVTKNVRFGASLAFRARVLPSGQAAVLEAVVRVLDPVETPPIDPGHPGFGPIDRLTVNGTETGFALRLTPDQETQQLWSATDGRKWRLRARGRWAAPANESRPTVVQTPLLHTEVLDFRLEDLSEEKEQKEGAPEAEEHRDLLAGLLSLVQSHPEFAAVDRDTGVGLLADMTANMAQIRDAVTRGLERATAGADVELRILDVVAGQAPAEDGTLPSGAREVARVQGHVIRGRSTCFTSYKERSYLAGWSVEVAQSARIPDPHVGRVREGWSTNLLLTTDGKIVLESEVRRIETVEVVNLPLDVAIQMPAQENPPVNNQPPVKMAAISLPQDVVSIEKPRISSQVIASTLVPGPDGVALLRRGAPRLFGNDRELLIVVRAK